MEFKMSLIQRARSFRFESLELKKSLEFSRKEMTGEIFLRCRTRAMYKIVWVLLQFHYEKKNVHQLSENSYAHSLFKSLDHN